MPTAHKTHIVTSLNRKGGVGKTHLCWLIASVCQERGLRCLVLDLDPQANFSSSLCTDGTGPTIDRLFDPACDPEMRTLIRNTSYSCIDVVPASPHLEPFNITDQKLWKSGDLQFSLAEALQDVAGDYDYILCDCPPSLSLVSYAALCASDFVMIPMEAARWGALGTQHIIAAVDDVRSRFNSRLRLLGYVVSRYKKRRAYQQTYLDQLRQHFGDDAFHTVIPDLAAFEKSVTDRIPITLHSPSSHAATIARQFFDEFAERSQRLARVGKTHGRRSLRQPAATNR